MDTPASIHEALMEYWGYSSFRPMQEEIIRSALDGNDTIGLLPTGGGKSITFQVPAVMLPGLTIVVTPLISLMKDQVDNLRRKGIRAGCLHAGMSYLETQYTLEMCRQGRAKLLYISPERAGSERFQSIVRSWNISLIVVDEAHCISQWGYDFRPSYMNVRQLREMFPATPVMALTASAPPHVVDDIARCLEMRNEKRFSRSFQRNNISFLLRSTQDKYGKLLDILRASAGSAIVYTRSRRKTADIAAMLQQDGFSATFYHAGLESHEKDSRQNEWMEGKQRIMVATTAFGMGIDKPDVRLVVHMDMPSSLEEYYQEAGRAGRDGKESIAVLLTSAHDRRILGQRLAKAFPSRSDIAHVYDEICRYLQVAMGEGFGCIYDFRAEDMCIKYQMPVDLVFSALSLLSRAGYIEYVDEMDIRAHASFTVPRHELYEVEMDEREEDLCNYMLRNYGGIFTDLVPIDENAMAAACGMTFPQVYEILKKWRREHVIAYIPRRSSPQVVFTANRVESSRLILERSIYEDRREAMRVRQEAMLDFADPTRTDSCRVQRMLSYFGDTGAGPCGKCDVCRSSARSFDPEAFTARMPEFFDSVAPHTSFSIDSLRPHYPLHFQQVVDTLMALEKEGRIRIEGRMVHQVKE